MKPSPTETICTRCGLCCDGSLFADVELARSSEASALEALGLDIEHGDESEAPVLTQPCGALTGTRCSIYLHRPNCCRTFECRLLRDLQSGVISSDQAASKIIDVQLRIARLKILSSSLAAELDHLPLKERCAEALELSEDQHHDPIIRRTRAELETSMLSVENLIAKTFLAD